jgi:hypothetical protein
MVAPQHVGSPCRPRRSGEEVVTTGKMAVGRRRAMEEGVREGVVKEGGEEGGALVGA